MSIPKKLRFDVLERDGFTCQYCGAKPADGALHVDHIIAVADGGQTAYENLITSCEPCNSGKGRRKLKARAPLDLSASTEQAQTRAAEIKAWRKAFATERQLVSEAIGSLRQHYDIAIPEHVLTRAIKVHGLKEVQYALAVTFDKGIPRTEFERQTAYFSKVLQNRREQGKATVPCVFGIDGITECTNPDCTLYDDDATQLSCPALQKWLGHFISPNLLDFAADVRSVLQNPDPALLHQAAVGYAFTEHRDRCRRCRSKDEDDEA